MIKTQTVLILGAGASAHLDYPLGGELVDRILTLADSSHIRSNVISVIDDVREKDILQFAKALRFSGSYSIDTFLEHRPEYIDIGKYFIAQSLIPHENIDKLYSANFNWYRYLFDKMNADFENFQSNKLAIVTFNYDRSIETYLFNSLKYKYKKSDAEVSNELSRIPIIHLHGKLGDLPWENAQEGRSYEPTEDPMAIKLCSEGIKIIHEKTGSDREFSLVKDLFQEATRIIFLGFGYNSINMQRLKIPYLQDKLYYGSSIRMTDLEIDEVKKRAGRLVLCNKYSNIEHYLRNNIIL